MPQFNCLGNVTCSFCARKLNINRFVIGAFCLEGWRNEAHEANTFFINMDGTPFIRIENEEEFAQEQFRKQQENCTNFRKEN